MMTKVLFFEVRSKTELFERIAERLLREASNIEIFWIVQNVAFRPKRGLGKTFLLDHALIEKIKNNSIDDIDRKVMSCDRFLLNFQKEAWYYRQYREKISEILEQVHPTIVFGELGNFFTHYGCLLCEEMKIPFYDTETSRFPNGSFSFFQYDKWAPRKLRSVTDIESANYLSEFLEHRPIPDYMNVKSKTHPIKIIKSKIMRVIHNVKLLAGYFLGDKFCTQNPIENLLRKREIKLKLRIWDRLSISLAQLKGKNKRIVLYPLQMEPEFNLHVWGYPYNNQQHVIEKIAENLPENWLLVLKINPKAFFEMRTLNLTRLAAVENICLAERNISMPDMDSISDIVATVTGTIQIERLLNNRPVAIFGSTPFRPYSCISKMLEQLTPDDFLEGRQKVLALNQQIDVAKFLLEHSTKGLISEPISDFECISPDNIENLTAAYLEIIKSHSS